MPQPSPRLSRRLEILPGDGGLRIVVGGVWLIADGLAEHGAVERALAAGGCSRLVVVAEGLERADSALAVWLTGLHDLAEARSVTLDLSGLDPGLARLVALARGVPERTGTDRDTVKLTRLDSVGHHVLGRLRRADDQIQFLGDLGLAVGRLVRGRARLRWRDVLEAMADSGPNSLMIVTVISALIGMILAFIGAMELRKFGAEIYVANLVGLAVVREMAAVMTGIVIAGKTGAAFAARIGTMQAQEEIDALTTLGVSSFDFLVLPRVIGLTLMMPLLYLYSCAVGLAGGMLIATVTLGIPVEQYWAWMVWTLPLYQFGIGVAKSAVFGALVAAVGCLRGLQCGRSAAAVGQATTSAVVTGILYIIIADSLFAILLEVYHL
ncbi:MAG: ABC transporter permease [Rhodospirillaceae bacterium]